VSRIEVTDEAVVVRFDATERLLGWKRELRVPLTAIEEVSVGLDDVPHALAWRVGLSVPLSDRRLGRFWSGGKKLFLDVRDKRLAVVLRLRPGSEFDVVALDADDPQALAGRIRKQLA
jgi:hypothetical protein